jgi:hypothetical protein
MPGVAQVLPQGIEYVRILPEIMLALFGMAIMVLDPLVDERTSQRLLALIAFIGSVAAIAATLYQSQYPGFGFWGMVKVDAFSIFFHFVVTAITAVVILSSYQYMQVQQMRAGEYYGLILFGAMGMCLMSGAVELVLIFIALEIFFAWIFRHGFLSLWSGADVWRNRFYQHIGDRPGASSQPDPDAGLCRSRVHVCRAGFQSGGGSFSCVDA